MPTTVVGLFEKPELLSDAVREIEALGIPRQEARSSYVEGLRRGGALAFATGSDEQVKAAGDIMNRHGAVEVEVVTGAEPQPPHVVHGNMDSGARRNGPGGTSRPGRRGRRFLRVVTQVVGNRATTSARSLHSCSGYTVGVIPHLNWPGCSARSLSNPMAARDGPR